MARASITSSRDFRRVYRAGQKARADGITVWAAPRPDNSGETRLGMAVRATVGSAVERNRLRRRTRAIVRAYDPAPGLDVVVSASQSATGKNFQELTVVLSEALRRAGVARRA